MTKINSKDDFPTIECGLSEGWATTELRNLVSDIQPGFACGGYNRDGEGIGHLRPMNVTEEGRIDLAVLKSVPKTEITREERLIQKGDVIFNNTNSPELVGKTALYTLPEPLAFSNHMTRVRCRADVLDPGYCALYLHQQWKTGYFVNICNNHVSQASVSSNMLRDTPMDVPPLTEQKRIVAKVEELLVRVNAARERLAKVPAILKRFRQSVLAAACSGQLTADWKGFHKRNSNAVEDWKILRIGELFKVTTGGTPSRKTPAFFSQGTIPWVKTGEVQNCDIYATEEHITHDAIENSSAKIFPAGTLLVALYGEGKTRGQIGRLMIDAATNQACAALINPKIDPITGRYVFFYLLGQYLNLREQSAGGNQPNLSVGLIRNWEILVPTLHEQQEIVRRVECLFTLADKIEARVQAATARVEKITQAILAKAFRGELVPTEAELARQEGRDYEPASVLLERIRTARTASSEPGHSKPSTRRTPKSK